MRAHAKSPLWQGRMAIFYDLFPSLGRTRFAHRGLFSRCAIGWLAMTVDSRWGSPQQTGHGHWRADLESLFSMIIRFGGV